jgi:uncharacterized membrane protein YhaH (DUF805 family)
MTERRDYGRLSTTEFWVVVVVMLLLGAGLVVMAARAW